MRILSAGQEAERKKDGVSAVWLIDATFDQYGQATTTRRYASREYTVSSNAYDGLIAERGIRLGYSRVKPTGGLAPVHSWSLRLRDEEAGSTITDTHVISNDPVEAYLIMPTGSEVESDRMELIRGVVERFSVRNNIWDIRLKDDSKKDLIKFPTKTLNPVQYPFAYNIGAVIPYAFGVLEQSPHITSYDGAISLSPVRFLDKFALTAQSSPRKGTSGFPYQWYGSAGRFAVIPNYTQTGGILTLDDPERRMRMYPARAKVGNTVTDWYLAADGRDTTASSIVNGDNLDVYMSGSPKLGTLVSATIYINAVGSYTYTIKDDTTVLAGPNPTSGNATYTLVTSNYTDWGFDLLNVEIDGTAAADIREIYLQVQFDDFIGLSEEEPQVYQSVQGYTDSYTNYNGGSEVNTQGANLRAATDVLEAILRDTDLCNLPTSKVDTASFNTAGASRSDWYFDFTLDEQVSDAFLDRYAYEAGLFLWNQYGKWTVAAMDKDRAPNHFFAAGYSTPVTGEPEDPQTWQYDLTVSPVDSSRIYNEVAIRYAPHPATKIPQRAYILSGQYRLSGTANLSQSNATLIDSSATFQTDGVAAGERIYVSLDAEYEVVSVDSQTQLTISALDGSPVSDLTGSTYYLGPHLSRKAFISQQAYKIVAGLGGNRQQSVLDDAGFVSQFIRDSATAQKLADHAIEWFSQPRDKINFRLMHDGLLVELGDVIMIDHPKLKPSQRGIQKTTIAEDLDLTETGITVAAGTAGQFKAGDYIYLQATDNTPPESMLVQSINTSTDELTVVRGQLGTSSRTHSNGAAVKRMTTKWIVTGLQPMSPDDPTIGVECEEMPIYYKPIGTVVDSSTPAYSSASAQQRASSGWSTLRNGQLVDYDPSSAISHAG